jgi:hypothetical protein
MKCEAQTEFEMQAVEAPTLHFIAELDEYISSLVDRKHDYGTCVYAMSLAATAAFNYVAGKLGVTGFQASCADLNILTRTRRIKGGFIILKAEDMLYPQYDLQQKLAEFVADQKAWLAEQAKAKLAEPHDDFPPHPRVLEHWQKLATAA